MSITNRCFFLEKLKAKPQPYDQKTLYEVSIELTTLAYNKGSFDNISIVLIGFDHSSASNTSTDSPKAATRRNDNVNGNNRKESSAKISVEGSNANKKKENEGNSGKIEDGSPKGEDKLDKAKDTGMRKGEEGART